MTHFGDLGLERLPLINALPNSRKIVFDANQSTTPPQLARNALYELLVHNKAKGGLGYKSKFAFKWIPDLVNVETPQGAPIPGRPRTSGALRHAGVERTALLTLLFVGALLGAIVWFGVRTVAAVFNGVVDMHTLDRGLEYVRVYA